LEKSNIHQGSVGFPEKTDRLEVDIIDTRNIHTDMNNERSSGFKGANR